MAEKSFGVKDINMVGATGDPTLESPGNLKITVGTGKTCTIEGGVVTTNRVVGDGSDQTFAIKYKVTANGSSAYRFAGPGLVNTTDNPQLFLQRGQTYVFDNTTGSAHPFAIRYSSGGVGYGSTYISGSQQGTQVFTVPFDAPLFLVYQCTMHSGMVGTLTIVA
jgi:hypothetical protein